MLPDHNGGVSPTHSEGLMILDRASRLPYRPRDRRLKQDLKRIVQDKAAASASSCSSTNPPHHDQTMTASRRLKAEQEKIKEKKKHMEAPILKTIFKKMAKQLTTKTRKTTNALYVLCCLPTNQVATSPPRPLARKYR